MSVFTAWTRNRQVWFSGYAVKLARALADQHAVLALESGFADHAAFVQQADFAANSTCRTCQLLSDFEKAEFEEALNGR